MTYRVAALRRISHRYRKTSGVNESIISVFEDLPSYLAKQFGLKRIRYCIARRSRKGERGEDKIAQIPSKLDDIDDKVVFN